MAVIFVSTGVSTGLMVDKMMKVAPGGLVVPLLPKQTQLQVQNPRLDVDFGVFIALRDKKKKLENTVVDMRGIRKIFSPINQDFSWPHPKKVIFAQKTQNIDMILWPKKGWVAAIYVYRQTAKIADIEKAEEKPANASRPARY